MHVEVTPVNFDELTKKEKGESSQQIRERVIKARDVQENRFEENKKIHANSQMNTKQIQNHCKLDEQSQNLLKTAMEKLDLSARAYDRILKVARTIADLDNAESISSAHIAEAIQYRSLDREGWAG